MYLFYGWKISLLSMGSNFMQQGAAIYCMNAFMEPLCEQNGWTRMGINFSLGLAAFMGQLAMPVAAALAEHISLRFLMAAGALAGGISTAAMGFVSNIYAFTVFLIIVWIASQFSGGVVANALMSNWFRHFRGLAFGLANAGTSLSGLVLPGLCMLLIDYYTLPIAFLIPGLVTCLLCPLSWLIVRNTPQMMHLHPDGRRHEPRQIHKNIANHSFSKMIRQPSIWYIGIAFGCALMAASGIISQLKPRFSDMGISAYTGIILASLSAGIATLAKFVWGWICDRVAPVQASRMLMLLCFCSMLLSFLPPTLTSLAAFGLCFCFCTGGLWVVLPAVTAYYFGALNFLPAYKLISIFIFLRCIGFPVMGISQNLYGNYKLADLVFTILLFLSFILTLLLKTDKAEENIAHRHKIAKK